MALFYNKKVFDKHKVAVPTTWDEYLDAARKLHKADPKAYIANDTGDAGLTTSLIWQAGAALQGRRHQGDGQLRRRGRQQVRRHVAEADRREALAPINAWSDDWYKGLGDGTIATLTTGAWMPANLASGVTDAAGDWRARRCRSGPGDKASAENGGSALALPERQEQGAGVRLRRVRERRRRRRRPASRAAPSRRPPRSSSAGVPRQGVPVLRRPEGQQDLRRVRGKNVAEDWSYLPFQVYANSVFNDTVGKAYVSTPRSPPA